MAKAAALRDELGSAPPAGVVEALSEAEADDLANALADARRRQAAELRAAVHGAYDHVPRLLRGPIRKIFGG